MYLAPGPTRILKLRFPAEPDYAAQFAESVVETTRKLLHIELDYSPASITHVEDVMCRLRNEGSTVNDIAETIFAFGCYVGEVIREAIGGEWYAHAPDRLALWTGEGDRDDSENDDIHDPIDQAFEFYLAPATQGLAGYVATIIGEPIESGITEPPVFDAPPELLRAVGMRLGTGLLAMRDNAVTAGESILLKMSQGEVIDDAWADDERSGDAWRAAREPGVARALIAGPHGTSAGFFAMTAILDAGAGPCVQCEVPTLPAGAGLPFTIYALQTDTLPQATRAAILGGIELIDPTLVVDEQPPRGVLRVEYLATPTRTE